MLKKRIHKKPFVLLEVMIAMALIGIAILPFLRYPSEQLSKEIDLLFNMKLERLATEELVKLRTDVICKNNFKKDLIFGSNAKEIPIEIDENFKVELPGKFVRTFIKQNYVYWDSQKGDKDKKNMSVCFVCKTEFYDKKKS